MKIGCKTCGKPITSVHRHNKQFCDKCTKLWQHSYAWRYDIGKNCSIWVRKDAVLRAVIDGKDVEPIRKNKEINEWTD
jgi:hypothetical protein